MDPEGESPVESGHLPAEGRKQARIDRRTVERMERRRMEGTGPEIECARTGDMIRGDRHIGRRRQPIACCGPGVEIRTVAALPDRPGDGADFAEIGAAIGDIGDRPGAEVLMQLVAKQASHGVTSGTAVGRSSHARPSAPIAIRLASRIR
jgi:hypothetical protein